MAKRKKKSFPSLRATVTWQPPRNLKYHCAAAYIRDHCERHRLPAEKLPSHAGIYILTVCKTFRNTAQRVEGGWGSVEGGGRVGGDGRVGGGGPCQGPGEARDGCFCFGALFQSPLSKTSVFISYCHGRFFLFSSLFFFFFLP